MDSLIEEAWCLYHESEDNPCVVKQSVPILFFGDSQRYFQSPLKVITVASTPRGASFPKATRSRGSVKHSTSIPASFVAGSTPSTSVP